MRYTAAGLLVAVAVAQAQWPGVVRVDDEATLARVPEKQELTVEGTVAKAEWSRTGKVCSIEFAGDPKFRAVAFEKARPKLDEAFGPDFAKSIDGAVVRFTGTVAAYGGQSKKYAGYRQMILSQTGQVTVMVPATRPAK